MGLAWSTGAITRWRRPTPCGRGLRNGSCACAAPATCCVAPTPRGELRGGSWPGHAHARAATMLVLTLEELDRLDVVVRDADRGVVDFPALREGEEVYLCWLVGEPAVTHWHALEAGFQGRRRL